MPTKSWYPLCPPSHVPSTCQLKALNTYVPRYKHIMSDVKLCSSHLIFPLERCPRLVIWSREFNSTLESRPLRPHGHTNNIILSGLARPCQRTADTIRSSRAEQDCAIVGGGEAGTCTTVGREGGTVLFRKHRSSPLPICDLPQSLHPPPPQ